MLSPLDESELAAAWRRAAGPDGKVPVSPNPNLDPNPKLNPNPNHNPIHVHLIIENCNPCPCMSVCHLHHRYMRGALWSAEVKQAQRAKGSKVWAQWAL